MELEDKADTTKKFFVRIKGALDGMQEQITEAFSPETIVTLGDNKDEFGFVTKDMSEGEYEAKSAKFPQICQMIRVK
jgi:homoserine dehydrogenase